MQMHTHVHPYRARNTHRAHSPMSRQFFFFMHKQQVRECAHESSHSMGTPPHASPHCRNTPRRTQQHTQKHTHLHAEIVCVCERESMVPCSEGRPQCEHKHKPGWECVWRQSQSDVRLRLPPQSLEHPHSLYCCRQCVCFVASLVLSRCTPPICVCSHHIGVCSIPVATQTE